MTHTLQKANPGAGNPSQKMNTIGMIGCGMPYRKMTPFICLAAILTVIFAVAELRHPYFFLNDDAFTYYLPSLVQAWNSLVRFGEISQYNFHQLLGVPTLGFGQAGVFYPFAYLSLGASYLFTGGCFLTMEVYSYIHILAGIMGMYIVLKYLKLSVITA